MVAPCEVVSVWDPDLVKELFTDEDSRLKASAQVGVRRVSTAIALPVVNWRTVRV
jgi:hypothetical protein